MTDRWEKDKKEYKEEYEITMTVPLGIRYGRMRFEENGGNITGIMDILGKTTTFTGLLKNEQIMISGELDIGIRKIFYTGYGTIGEDGLHMQIRDKEATYNLTGLKKICK